MIQVYKKLNGVNILHKEKERLRHHNQIELLNKVMENVPVSPHQSKTRVKKLRQLVLYVNYLKMIHTQLRKKFHTTVDDDKCSNKVPKPVLKPLKICHEQKPKRRRAHIVFLHPDKSINEEENTFQKKVSCYEVERGRNFQRSTPDCISEYKVPDVVFLDSKVNNKVNIDQSILSSVNSNNTGININPPVPCEYETPSQSVFMNLQEGMSNELESGVPAIDLFYDEKENISPVAKNNPIRSCNENFNEEIPAQIIDDQNLMTSVHGVPQNYLCNYILEDLTSAKVSDNCFNISKVGTSDQSQEYLLHPYEVYPFQNVPDTYDSFQGSPQNFTYQSSILSSSNFCLSDNFSNSLSSKPPNLNWSASENVADNSNSSTLTDKMNIDVENLSDSNPSYTNLSDSSNSFFNTMDNYYDSSPQFYCDSVKLPIKQASPDYKTIKYEKQETYPNSIPNLPPTCSYFENHPLKTEVLLNPVYDISQSYFSNIYPANVCFNGNPTVFYPPESVFSLPDRNVQCSFGSDPDSFYSSPYENFHSDEFSFVHQKPNSINLDNYPGPSQSSPKPSFFGEETSYSLAQYIKKY